MARNRILSALAPATFGIGWMLSPESFLLIGNAAGQLEYLVIAALILAASAHLVYACTVGIDRPYSGNTVEFILETGAYLPAAVSAGTLILASAGYAFNEIFAVWFPNLLFSFCVLAIILAVNLAGPKASDILQLLLMAVVIICILILLAIGFTGSSTDAVNASAGKIETPAPWRYAFWLPVLFFGYGLASGLKSEKKPDRKVTARIITVLAVFFIFWALISLKWIAPYRLSNLTIPHILTARAIGGDFGRGLMGLVVVCGGAAAVNLLVRGAARKLAKSASSGFLPAVFMARAKAPPVPLILISGGIAAMMGIGMAGEPITEVFMRGGLLMWLALLAYRSFSALVSKRSEYKSKWALFPGVFFLVSAAVFLVTEPELRELFKFTVVVITALILWSAFRKIFQKSDGGGINGGKGTNPAEPGCEQC